MHIHVLEQIVCHSHHGRIYKGPSLPERPEIFFLKKKYVNNNKDILRFFNDDPKNLPT